jgi:hypothetical protein
MTSSALDRTCLSGCNPKFSANRIEINHEPSRFFRARAHFSSVLAFENPGASRRDAILITPGVSRGRGGHPTLDSPKGALPAAASWEKTFVALVDEK